MDLVIKESTKKPDSGEGWRKLNSVFVFEFYSMSSPKKFDEHYKRKYQDNYIDKYGNVFVFYIGLNEKILLGPVPPKELITEIKVFRYKDGYEYELREKEIVEKKLENKLKKNFDFNI
jgi:hypothetical protein